MAAALSDSQAARLEDLIAAVAMNYGEPVDLRDLGAARTYDRLMVKGYVTIADVIRGPNGGEYPRVLPTLRAREWYARRHPAVNMSTSQPTR